MGGDSRGTNKEDQGHRKGVRGSRLWFGAKRNQVRLFFSQFLILFSGDF